MMCGTTWTTQSSMKTLNPMVARMRKRLHYPLDVILTWARRFGHICANPYLMARVGNLRPGKKRQSVVGFQRFRLIGLSEFLDPPPLLSSGRTVVV
jgi:hypothetical protein